MSILKVFQSLIQKCRNLTYDSFALSNTSDITDFQLENSRNSYFCKYHNFLSKIIFCNNFSITVAYLSSDLERHIKIYDFTEEI